MTKEVSEESLNELLELLREKRGERITITVERCDEGWKAVAESEGKRVICRGERMKETVWNVCVEMEGGMRRRDAPKKSVDIPVYVQNIKFKGIFDIPL